MKTFNLVAFVSSAILLASTAAYADTNSANQQFMSKRPYHQMPETEAYNANDKWEGATLVNKDAPNEDGITKQGVEKQPHLRLHSLGKRPFIEKSDAQ